MQQNVPNSFKNDYDNLIQFLKDAIGLKHPQHPDESIIKLPTGSRLICQCVLFKWNEDGLDEVRNQYGYQLAMNLPLITQSLLYTHLICSLLSYRYVGSTAKISKTQLVVLKIWRCWKHQQLWIQGNTNLLLHGVFSTSTIIGNKW